MITAKFINMVSLETEARLARLMLFVGQQEHEIEQTRQAIARLPNFEPYACFQRLDRLEHGYLTATDLFHFYRDNGLDAVEAECAAIVAYFDSNNDSALSFFDFLHILLPCENPTLRASASQRPTYEVNRFDFLPREVEAAVARLLEQELALLQRTEALKKDLLARYDCNLIEAFALLAGPHSAGASFEEFERFLKKNGHLPHETEIVGLVRRVDRDADFQISYKEFMEFVMPCAAAPEPHPLRAQEEQDMQREMRTSRSGGQGSGSLSPFRRSYNRLTQLEREISQDVPVRSRQSPARSPTRREPRYNPPARAFQDTIDFAPPPPPRVFPDDPQRSFLREERSRSPGRRSVRFADEEEQKFEDHGGSIAGGGGGLSRNGWHMRTSSSRGTDGGGAMRRSNGTATATPTRTPPRRTPKRPARTELSPSNSLNLSARRCEACHPGLREKPGQVRSKKSSVKKSAGGAGAVGGGSLAASKKSPFRKTRKLAGSSTPGRASTKYSEGASPGIVRFSPMRADDEGALVEVLKQQIGMEREAERQRQELALCADFNLMDVFKFFDRRGTGAVSQEDLEVGLHELRVQARPDELALLLAHFDVDGDRRLKFTEFSGALTPRQSEYSAVLHNRNPQFAGRAPLDVLLSRETRGKLGETLRVLLDLEGQAEALRRRVGFSVKEAFVACDRDGNGVITADEFRALLGEFQVFVSEKELALLVERYDRHKQLGVSFSAFVEELTPKL